MLLHKSIEHDSRVRRAARALAGAGHEVTVLHLPRRPGELDGELEGFRVRSVTPPVWMRRRLPTVAYRTVFLLSFLFALRKLRPDAVHAHDAAMLGPGAIGARLTGARLVYDSHEFALGVPYRKPLWGKLVAALERLTIGRCNAVITVSDGIADRLREHYGLERRPVVVRNLPDPAETDRAFEAPSLRAELGLVPEAPLVLHLGAAALDRGCETLIAAMAVVPDAHLLFLGVDDSAYVESIGEVAAGAGVGGRVHTRPSVPVGQIRSHARQATVGVSLLEDTCENHRLALPNKVFEYLAAGVPAVAADLPELRRTLGDDPAATLVDSADPAAVAGALRATIAGPPSAVSAPFEWSEDAGRLVSLYAGLAVAGTAAGGGRALVLVRNGVTHDARIRREAGLLEEIGFEVTVAGVVTGADPAREERLDGIRVVRLDPAGLLRRMLRRTPRLAARGRSAAAPPADGPGAGGRPDSSSPGARLRRLATTTAYYRAGIGLVRRLRPGLIHANDYNTAWIGVIGKWTTGARLIYDSHELWPDRNLRPEPRGWLLLCESLFVRVADEVITTSPGYAQVLARRYRIAEPRLIRNVPGWKVAAGEEERPSGAGPLAVYFGAITRNRGLATALRALALVPELHMRFVGPEAWGYRAELAALAEELGVAGRLELLDPVPPDRAASVLADADLGLALIEPACLSYRMTLPNKLYEYVAAGLPILAGEVPVLAAEVRGNRIGLVADPADPVAVAAALRAMLEPDAQRELRAAVRLVARDAVWEREQVRLSELYEAVAPR